MNEVIYGGKKYKVTYAIFDEYDFDQWENTNRTKIEIFINDTFGYNLQGKGILNTYNYIVSGEFYYYD